jgi:RecB family exonuclease
MREQIISWSHSKLGDFETCKLKARLKHIDRIPEPERPLPPGKTEHANDRGTRIHDNCEHYVRGLIHELCPEADKHFGPQLDLLRVLYAEGLVSLEGEWGMNHQWEPHPWKGEWQEISAEALLEMGLTHNIKATALPPKGRDSDIAKVGKKFYIWVSPWLRLKLDALVFHDEKTATVIDYKSGRKFGNEVKHGEQLQLYQLVTFLRYPALETIYAELWYLDQPEGSNLTSIRYLRPQGLKFKSNFDRRGRKLTTNTDWPANPNRFSCKWCPYGPWEGGSGHCTVGVK